MLYARRALGKGVRAGWPRKSGLARRGVGSTTPLLSPTSQTASEFLQDPLLLRELAYVDGKWTGGASTMASYAVEGERVS